MLIEAILALTALPVVLLIATVVQRLLFYYFGKAAQPSAPFEGIAGSPDRFQRLALIVLAVAVAPIAEEFFFRGMLHNALRRRIHPILAAVVSGTVFGLIHPFGYAERVVIAVIGSFVAIFYEWRKTLLAPTSSTR